MGQSSRASRIKKNNQALKKRVFGPVEAARNERLHAKLLELAQAPKEIRMQEPTMTEAEATAEVDTEDSAQNDMKVDDADSGATTTTTKPAKSKREIGRIRAARAERTQKSTRRKPRNQVAFPKHPKKKISKR